MPVSSALAISASGLAAAQTALGAAAHNIANLGTSGARRQTVQQQAGQQAGADGGVSSRVGNAPQAGTSPETDMLGLLQARNAWLANLAVFRASDRMAGSLLDAQA
jgi:flagellar basal body rod protein FlgC